MLRSVSPCCARFLVGAIVVTCCVTSFAQEVSVSFVPEGVTRKVGGYRPVRAKMSNANEDIKTQPENLANPKYGTLEFGDASFAFILDEPEDGEKSLFIDSNRDGDLTNDPEVAWQPREVSGLTMYNGSAKVDLGADELATINLYRFDPNDTRRAALKDVVLYYGDFGYEYSFELDGKQFSTFVAGNPTASSSLPIDRDGNGRVSRNYETAKIGEPFNFTGTTYQFGLEDGELILAKAKEELEQLALPPDLSVGKKALSFSATNLDGESVEFPQTYAGKIVMLDFWATWCGPCIGEIPHMKEAYSKWNDSGFEILGISFDQAKMEEKVEKFLEDKELPWAQIYEGKGWNTTLGKKHDVSAIPFVLLVDGDSGEILATTRQLRGPGLVKLVEEKLKEKFGDSFQPDTEDKTEADGDSQR